MPLKKEKAARPCEAAPCASDSYDDDLGWILTKFGERTGASCGAIFRFTEGEQDALPLALYEFDNPLPAAAVQKLRDSLRPHFCQPAQAPSDPQSFVLDLRAEGGPAVRVLFLRFVPSPGVIIVVAICRPEASFQLLEKAIAARLQPVLERYTRLWWLHRTERRRANVLQRAIDQSDLGLALLDRRGRLLFANQATLRVLDQADGLRRLGISIAATNAGDVARFQRAVAQAIQENRSASPGVKPCWSTLLTVGRPGKRALIVSVGAVDRVAIDPEDAAAVLYVLDPADDIAALLAPACRIYRLTAAEARLVSNLVSGADLAAAAATMNLAVHTARSYLKQIFLKTSTNRQAELVRVMCGSAARAAIASDFSLL